MLPEEVTKLIGKAGDTMIMEVEKGAIRRYADAVGDYNPIYWDEKYAKNSRYGSIIAPPGFFGWPTKWTDVQPTFSNLIAVAWDTMAKVGYGRALYGGTEYEFFRPVRAGDTLVALPRFTNTYEREGRTGQLLFLIAEITYTNQNGDLVANQRHTFIFYR